MKMKWPKVSRSGASLEYPEPENPHIRPLGARLVTKTKNTHTCTCCNKTIDIENGECVYPGHICAQCCRNQGNLPLEMLLPYPFII